MTRVKELIKFLECMPPDMPVAFKIHSEAKTLMVEDISIKRMQPPRSDGWIHEPWKGEPKLEEIDYLLFPGN